MSNKYGEVARAGRRSKLALKMYNNMASGDVMLVVEALEDAIDIAHQAFSDTLTSSPPKSTKNLELLKLAISGFKDGVLLAEKSK